MKDAKIYIAGHTGMLGRAILDRFKKEGYKNIVIRTHQELDLARQAEVESFFRKEKPQLVILAAARVGGIHANMSYPAQFLYDNLSIQTNIIDSSFRSRARKLLFFASACSYPRDCPQPMKEEYLLSGYLEPTNEAYAVAKIAGIKMCQAYNRQYGTNFITAVPTNTYGPGDNFNQGESHVIPSLINRFHKAKVKEEPAVTIWGTGTPRRDFVYVDDVADASFFLLQNYNNSDIINIGSGEDVTIKDLADIIKEIVGYEGKILFDASKPDGIPRKWLDVTRLKDLGWQVKTPLSEGIRKTYEWYLNHLEKASFDEK